MPFDETLTEEIRVLFEECQLASREYQEWISLDSPISRQNWLAKRIEERIAYHADMDYLRQFRPKYVIEESEESIRWKKENPTPRFNGFLSLLPRATETRRYRHKYKKHFRPRYTRLVWWEILRLIDRLYASLSDHFRF